MSAKKIAVCIGINDYPGTNSDLHGCVNDARDWSHALEARGFTCHLLLDRAATAAAIRHALHSLAQTARAGDVVFVTFSGHGTFVPDQNHDEPDGTDECWVPYDIMSAGPISDDELFDIYATQKPGVRWIVISDSCHSGTMARFHAVDTPPTTRETTAPQRLVRFLPPSVFRPELDTHDENATRIHPGSPPGRRGALLLSGCQDREYSYDAWFQGRPNGAFTFVALRELPKLRPGSNYEDWHRQIRQSLPSQQYPQAPNLYGSMAMKEWKLFEGERSSAQTSVPISTALTAAAGSPPRPSFAAGEAIAAKVLKQRQKTLAKKRERREEGSPRGSTPLIAEGDSWFDYPWFDVLTLLEDEYDYEVEAVAHKGDTLEAMAYSGGQLSHLLRKLERMLERGRPPRAILLSGGGNDVAGDEFAQFFNHSDSPLRGLNESILQGVIDTRLRDSTITIVGAVTKLAEEQLGTKLPILLHGYDYPVPDGRGYWSGWWLLPGPWLLPGLERKGYRDGEENRQLLQTLIDRMNQMQIQLEAEPGFEHVQHVDLRGVLPQEGNYQKWWDNELHPTRKGFKRIAAEFDRVLESL